MKTVLFAALTCALFVTACQKEDSANLNENNVQKFETYTGAILADKAALKNIPVIVVSNCALLTGWGKNPTIVNDITSRSATTVAGDNNITTTGNMQLSVFPNPYGSVVNFRFKTTVSGRVELVIYNIVGARLAVIDKGHIQAGTWQTIQYHVPAGTHPTLVYRLFTGSKVMSGKILPKQTE